MHGYIVFANIKEWYEEDKVCYYRYYVIAETPSKAKYKAFKELDIYPKKSEVGFWLFITFDDVEVICLDNYFKELRKQTIFDYIG